MSLTPFAAFKNTILLLKGRNKNNISIFVVMCAMQKQKKVTVKFFLNKAVEPVSGEKGEKNYPLYVQVTYNRKNMQAKSHYGAYYKSLDEVKPALLKFEEKLIRKIIGYEASLWEGDYDLKGLKRKYAVYSISILSAIEAYIKPKLRLAVFKTKNQLSQVLNFNEQLVTVGMLYKAASLLFPDLDKYTGASLQDELNAYDHYVTLQKGPILTYNFPTIIEWMDGSYKTALTTKLNGGFENNVEISTGIVALINEAVDHQLKAFDR